MKKTKTEHIVVKTKAQKRKVVKNLPALERFPEEKWGSFTKKSDFTYTTPRHWVKEETDLLIEWCKAGYSVNAIAQALSRSPKSITNKIRRVKKWIIDEYNSPEAREAKYNNNKKFLAMLDNPKTCLDAYSGCGSYWTNNTKLKVTTNDNNEEFDAMYHMDADRLLAKMYSEKKTFDVVDIDPYGSPFMCIDNAIAITKKGLILTFGEKGHIQQNRTDYVNKCYGIKKMDKLKIKEIINYVKKRAIAYDKVADERIILESNSIWRVYFTISKRKERQYDQREHMTEDRRKEYTKFVA